jgi:hypothetical protein
MLVHCSLNREAFRLSTREQASQRELCSFDPIARDIEGAKGDEVAHPQLSR